MKKLVLVFLLMVSSQMVSAQSVQEILRPTLDSNGGTTGISIGCFGTNQASSAMPLSRDAAGLTTSSSLTVGSSATKTSFYQTRLFTTWPSTAQTYTALVLNINWQASRDDTPDTGNVVIAYSNNGGSTWFFVSSAQTNAQNTNTLVLSAAQNLSLLRVGICVQGTNTTLDPPGNSYTGRIWDIWTVGTYTPAASGGSGSTTGNAHRAIVVIN